MLAPPHNGPCCSKRLLCGWCLQVGHNALGAGQLIDQGASLVDNALRTGSMFSGEGWQVGREGAGIQCLGLINSR